MAEHERTTQGKNEKVEQKCRTRQQESKPVLDKSLAWNQGLLSLTETPFHPQMDEHATILSSIPFTAQRHEFIMRLHQTYGNRYVQRLMESMKVQAKLTVSDPNDVYEQEADRVADTVTRTIQTPVSRQENEEELQMQEEEEEPVQMKIAQVQRQPQEEEEEVQAKTSAEIQFQAEPEEEEEQVQAKSTDVQPEAVSESIEARINNARGSGHPLSTNVREPMEQAFGTDFSDVRVHNDSEAGKLNQRLSAKAFTTGQDVFFGDGEYSPDSDSGRKLIAHELTHVAQQNLRRINEKNRMLTSTLITNRRVVRSRAKTSAANNRIIRNQYEFYRSLVYKTGVEPQGAQCSRRKIMNISQEYKRYVQRAYHAARRFETFAGLKFNQRKKPGVWAPIFGKRRRLYHSHIIFDRPWTLPKVGFKNNIGFERDGLFSENVGEHEYHDLGKMNDKRTLFSVWYLFTMDKWRDGDYRKYRHNCHHFLKAVKDANTDSNIGSGGKNLWLDHAPRSESIEGQI